MSEEPDESWLHEARPPMSAWERALRPNGASRGLLALLLVAVGVFLTLAVWTALQDAHRLPQDEAAAPQAATPDESTATPPASTRAAAVTPVPEPRTQQISKCTSRAGSATYSDAPCPTGTFTSVVTVRPDTNVVDGLTAETRQASIRNNAVAAQGTAQYERQVASNLDRSDSRATAECRQIDIEIAAIDAAARQPRPAYDQDRLKADRMRLRDRQFALRCA